MVFGRAVGEVEPDDVDAGGDQLDPALRDREEAGPSVATIFVVRCMFEEAAPLVAGRL